MFTHGMMSTCLSNDSTIVWTQHLFTQGLLRTISYMAHSGECVSRTALGSQPAVIGIDRFMSITNMPHFTLCTCWLCVTLSNSICYYQTCMLTFTLCVLTFTLTYVTGA
ncbi:hypothetical protein HanRHA438_Chr05g0214751 [Helianthus annuus]|nr:hypothetical protein HanRHA438_Chr05g0214751 [Helianthus annuus]